MGQAHRAGALQVITTRTAPDSDKLSRALGCWEATPPPEPYTFLLQRLADEDACGLLHSKFDEPGANAPPPDHEAERIAVDVCEGNPLLLHLVGGLLADPDAGVTPEVRGARVSASAGVPCRRQGLLCMHMVHANARQATRNRTLNSHQPPTQPAPASLRSKSWLVASPLLTTASWPTTASTPRRSPGCWAF